MKYATFTTNIKDVQVLNFATYYLNNKTFSYHTSVVNHFDRMKVYATLPEGTIVRPIICEVDGQRRVLPSKRLTKEIDGVFTITSNYYEYIFSEPIGEYVGFQYWPNGVA